MRCPDELLSLLKKRKATLSVAESLTGGSLSAAIVGIPGISEVFFGGVVSYVDGIKERLLGVSRETLLKHTAVSAETAAEMARGAAERFSTDYALSTTGLAGPGGGTPEIPVGTVFVGLYAKGRVSTFRLSLSGTRDEIREKTVEFALDTLIKELTF